jgi:hypothetical protein
MQRRSERRHMTQSPDNTSALPSISPLLARYRSWQRRIAGTGRQPFVAPPPDGLLTAAEAARKQQRKPTLEKLLKQAAKAGKSVKGAEVYRDRTVLQFGEPEAAEPENPWPLDEFRTKETKQ